MDNQTYLIVLIFFVCLGVVYLGWIIRRQKKRPTAKKRQSENYHGVTISIDDKACHAVKQLSGKRFLASEAPQLPLADCNTQHCFCQYMHHPDRRLFKDRRQLLVYNDEKQNTEDQRQRKDRRTTHSKKDSQ